MVTLSKTWYVDTNVIPSDQTTANAQWRRLALNLKRFLTGATFYEDGVRVPDGSGQPGVWTVQRSSNGTLNTATDGAADYWTAVADIIGAAGGVAHSWIVLRSPVGTGFLPGSTFIEILIDLNTAGNESVSISWAPGSNPFTVGTNINAPTLPTNGASLGLVQICENTSLANHKMHLWRDSEGDIFLTTSRDGSGGFGTVIYALQGENGEPSSVYPCTVGAVSSGMLSSVLSFNTVSSATSAAGWFIDNTQKDVFMCIQKNGNNSDATAGYGTGGGSAGRNPAMPIDLYNIDANQGLYHGRIPDIRYGSVGQTNLTLESTVDVWKRMDAGSFVLFKHDSDTLPAL